MINKYKDIDKLADIIKDVKNKGGELKPDAFCLKYNKAVVSKQRNGLHFLKDTVVSEVDSHIDWYSFADWFRKYKYKYKCITLGT